MNAKVHCMQIFSNQGFLSNKEINLQRINENDILSKCNNFNILLIPESINLCKNHNNNDQDNNNDILFTYSSNKHEVIDQNLIPIFCSNKSFSLSNESLEYQSENMKLESLKYDTYSRTRWTEEEDKRLIRIIKKIGARKWNKIAELMKTRTAKQCRDHYANCLNPNIKKTLWSIEEEQILLEKYQEYGSYWSRIKRYLPGRTASMIKNYMKMLLKTNGKDGYLKSNDNDSINEENASSMSSNLSSGNDDQSFSMNFPNTQNNNDFSYHNINYLLNKP